MSSLPKDAPVRRARVVAEPPPPLDQENRTAVDTAAAAYYLNRQPQTLRGWACHEDGPLRPIRIHGRLAWPVAELRRILEVAVVIDPAAMSAVLDRVEVR